MVAHTGVSTCRHSHIPTRCHYKFSWYFGLATSEKKGKGSRQNTTMINLNTFLTPLYVPVGIILCLLLIRSIRCFIYNRRLKALGGIHAPRIPDGPIAGNPRIKVGY